MFTKFNNMKPMDYRELTKNTEMLQKRFFDNAGTVVKTFYEISTGNLEMFRSMTEDLTSQVTKETTTKK